MLGAKYSNFALARRQLSGSQDLPGLKVGNISTFCLVRFMTFLKEKKENPHVVQLDTEMKNK